MSCGGGVDAIEKCYLVRCELMRAGRELANPGLIQICRKAKTVRIGKKRFAELKDIDHLHVRVTGGHLRERRVVGHVKRMSKRNHLGALCLRRWRDAKIR